MTRNCAKNPKTITYAGARDTYERHTADYVTYESRTYKMQLRATSA
jgi:hypothetical protein